MTTDPEPDTANIQWLRKADFVAGLVLALMGCAVLLAVLNFRWDLPSVVRDGWYTAPGIVPAGAAIILILQGLSLAIRAMKSGGRWQSGDLAHVKSSLSSSPVRRAGLVAVLLSAFVFGMVGNLHFTLASFLFLVVFMAIFRAGRWWKILLISALASFTISYAFETVARIPLP